MMERYLDEVLKELNTELIKMASKTENAIYRSIDALKNRDRDLANKVIAEDKSIDEMEIKIDEKAVDIFALQQPVAFDLRFITTAIKVNAEIERIADLAVNISQRVLELADAPLLKPLIDIPKLSDIARKMVKGAIDAFVKRDEKMAKGVIFADSEADVLRNVIQKEIVYDYLIKDGSLAPRAIPLLLVARHLERICDHATYIAEDVIYMVKARVVKHHPERLQNRLKKEQ